MKISSPRKSDFVILRGREISLTKMNTLRVDYNNKQIIYETWIDVNQQDKLGTKHKGAIATESIDISTIGILIVDGDKQECFVRQATYSSRMHMYLLQFVVYFDAIPDKELKKSEFAEKEDDDIAIEIEIDGRGDFIEFD